MTIFVASRRASGRPPRDHLILVELKAGEADELLPDPATRVADVVPPGAGVRERKAGRVLQ